MGDLTHDFDWSEMACHDGTPVPPELRGNMQKLANNLQVLRDKVGAPIHIVSGYRTPQHNAVVDGAGHSQHMLAKAADIQVQGMTPKQVCALVKQLISEKQMAEGGVGLYDSWVHYDVRGTPARWGGA